MNYIQYSTWLRKVIGRVKATRYEQIIRVSTNKSKVSWEIVKKETGKEPNKTFAYPQLSDGKDKLMSLKQLSHSIYIL